MSVYFVTMGTWITRCCRGICSSLQVCCSKTGRIVSNCCNGCWKCIKVPFKGCMNGIITCCGGYMRCIKTCFERCIDCTVTCCGGCMRCTETCFKRCIDCTITCGEGCMNSTETCFNGCIKYIKTCCRRCTNYIIGRHLAGCQALKKYSTWINSKIALMLDWNQIGPKLPLVHFFLLYIPLKFTGYIVASGNLIYSILCFSLLMIIAKHNDEYLDVYASKMDVFIFLVTYLSSTTHFMITCMFLFVGTFLKNRKFVEIYLWSVVWHVVVNILNTIAVSLYCIIDNHCFTGSGSSQSLIGLLICFFYTMAWVYIISSLNSMMENPPSPHSVSYFNKR